MGINSFYKKMIAFACILCTLPVIFIGTFSYIQSSNEIQDQVGRSKLQLLKQTNSNVEQILKTVNHSTDQLIMSTLIETALKRQLDAVDFQLYNDLRSELSNLQAFDTKVEDVILLNTDQNWIMKNSGLYRLDQYEYQEPLQTLFSLPENSSWTVLPSKWFYIGETVKSINCDYVVSLVKKLPALNVNKYGLAIANIPVCGITDLLQNSADEYTIILDDQSRILAHWNPELIGKSLTEAGYATQEIQFSEKGGQFKVTLDDRPFTVNYITSQYNGWTYLSYTSINALTEQSKKIGIYTAGMCILLVLVFLVIAWLGSKKMYTPIQNLMRKLADKLPDTNVKKTNEFQIIDEQMQRLFQSQSALELEVQQHLQQVRTFFLFNLYHGKLKKAEIQEKFELFGYAEYASSWNYKAVLTIQIDALESTRYEKKDAELLLFAINNMMEEIIPQDQRVNPVIISETQVTLVGSDTESLTDFQNFIYKLTERIQQTIQQLLELQISIGISLPFETLKNASIAYREGLEALKHRLKLGSGVIIPYENINSGRHFLHMKYPKSIEADMLDAIKLAEEEKAKELLHEFLEALFAAELSPQEYQIPLIRLLNSFLLVIQESSISLSLYTDIKGSLYEELLVLHTTQEIEHWFFHRIVQPMIQTFRDRRDSQYQNISEKMIDIIHQEYSSDLTIEKCASMLHYNANYLSSVFRKETNMTFSEYLTAYRFNKAKEWLVSTDKTVKDIAEQLHYNNSQNFIRSFRKLEGITPGQYREKYKQ
ncbi:AraC family transcriptional regulator [Marinicrinis lubricantis]|uniref:AraC family transcriptional regulator n=1 Tax=Marinicrinis lubricantis TaxID=2086470 RepID=A0ABW1IJK0_9BACL